MGFVINSRNILYLIGGGTYLPIKLHQSFKFTTMTSSIAKEEKRYPWGGVVGLGMGTAVTNHVEFRLEFMKSFLEKLTIDEVHGSNDVLAYRPREILGTFSLIYKF